MARELHDDVSQRLALLEMQGAETPGLRDAIRQLSQDIRDISHRLHPKIIEDLGLASALQALSDEFRDREHMITSFFQQDVPETIPPETAISLYRIAQEALRNVAKHAGRTHVKISLRGEGGRLQLQVSDSGIGFDVEDLRSGLGLISMEERARQIGATFRIECALGEGTRITVDAPLNPPA